MKQRCPERFVDVPFPGRPGFRVPFYRADGAFWELNISFLFDGYECDGYGCAETELCKDGEWIDVKEWGYDGVRHRIATGSDSDPDSDSDKSTVDVLIAEIVRLESAPF